MTNVFITGDRSGANPFMAGMIAMEMLRAAGAGDKIVTGDNPGVEEIVRKIADDADLAIDVVQSPRVDGSEHIDWDRRHRRLRDDEVKIVLFHVDPMSSRVGRSLMSIMPDDQLKLVSFLG